MERKNGRYVIAVLVMMIVVMSIGFAATSYTQLLTISGNEVTVKSASWNIHFDTNSYVESPGSITGTHSLSNTELEFREITLSPGEFYSAEVDVVNTGTLNAELSSITITPTLSTAQQKYLRYYFVYDNQTFTESQVLSSGLALNAGATKHAKVYLEYFTNENNANDLPEDDEVLTLKITLQYNNV